jgi:hypothetical protein
MAIEDRIFQLLREISYIDGLPENAKSWFNTNLQAAPWNNNNFFPFLQQRLTALTKEENQRLIEWQPVAVEPHQLLLPQQTSPQSPDPTSLSTILDDMGTENSSQSVQLDANPTPEFRSSSASPPGIKCRASDSAAEQFDSFSAVDPIDPMQAGSPSSAPIESEAPDPATDLGKSCQVIQLDANPTPESRFSSASPPGIEGRALDSFSAVDTIDPMQAGNPSSASIESGAPDPETDENSCEAVGAEDDFNCRTPDQVEKVDGRSVDDAPSGATDMMRASSPSSVDDSHSPPPASGITKKRPRNVGSLVNRVKKVQTVRKNRGIEKTASQHKTKSNKNLEVIDLTIEEVGFNSFFVASMFTKVCQTPLPQPVRYQGSEHKVFVFDNKYDRHGMLTFFFRFVQALFLHVDALGYEWEVERVYPTISCLWKS